MARPFLPKTPERLEWLSVRRKARSQVMIALQSGRLIRAMACEGCGEHQKLHAHHHDYARPLSVCWLCASCHNQLHVDLRNAKRLPPGARRRGRVLFIPPATSNEIATAFRHIREAL